MKQYVRTIRGDIDHGDLGVTYAHEHVVLDALVVEARFPDILLNDADAAVAELAACATAGVRTVIDALPCGIGRHPERLAAISARSGVHIIATTGLHTAKWYPGCSWANEADPGTLAGLFIADIVDGIDRFDYSGPITVRTPHCAGLIKVGTLQEQLDGRDRRVFAAAAQAHLETGVPILTHCEGGVGGLEQVALLVELGVDPGCVVLSHTDKVTDPGYHRTLLESGVFLEYDQALRHPLNHANPSARLVIDMVEAGYLGRIMLGTDGARRTMWASLGGQPGLAALASGFIPLLRELGVGQDAIDAIMVANPARFFSMAPQS